MCSVSKEILPRQKPFLQYAYTYCIAIIMLLTIRYVHLPSMVSYATALSIGFIRSSSLVIFGLAVLLMWFVQYYAGKKLRKCSPVIEHLVSNSKSAQSIQCIVDLDKVASSEGLSKMWRDEVQGKAETLTILLTGVTGYVGRAFLFQLLREIAKNDDSNHTTKLHHKVYVMVRANARKGLSAADRLDRLKQEPMFTSFRKHWGEVVVPTESGDLQEDQCGMSYETLAMLRQANISHVVHCAADVNFNRPLADSASINISPVLQLQELAFSWPSCKRFVHCSTAFVNPGCGSPENPMAEKLFPLSKYDPQDLYESMQGDQRIALKAKSELAFPNNYVFTKCVAEHLLVRNSSKRDVTLNIVRPAIVGPAWVLPEPGWNGDKPSTITALLLLWGTRVIRFAPLAKEAIPMVPVDVVCVGILHAMISPSTVQAINEELASTRSIREKASNVGIRNLIWSHTSPHSCIGGQQMADECLPAAVLKNHFSATETAISFALIDFVNKFPRLFPILHAVFNLGPLYVLQFVCWTAKVMGIKSILDQLPVTKLLKFSDMLTLYKPYTGRNYYFESSINVPESLNMGQYCASLFSATHAFWTKLFPGTIEDLSELELLPQGRWDFWWALTLPTTSFANRIYTFLACKILRQTHGSVKVDVESMCVVARAMRELQERNSNENHCTLLTSSCQTPLDYILAKYTASALVGLGIDITDIVHESELTQKPDVITRIQSKSGCCTVLVPCVNGSLRTLLKSPRGSAYTVIPFSVECTSWQRSSETTGASVSAGSVAILSLVDLLWKVCVLGKDRKRIHGARISFGNPLKVAADSDLLESTTASQPSSEENGLVYLSQTHLAAAKDLFGIEQDTLLAAFKQLSVPFSANASVSVDIESWKSWNIQREWLCYFVPFLRESHPGWADWIRRENDQSGETVATTSLSKVLAENEVKEVLDRVCQVFDAADYLAIRAKVSLREQQIGSPDIFDLVKDMKMLDVKFQGDFADNDGPEDEKKEP